MSTPYSSLVLFPVGLYAFFVFLSARRHFQLCFPIGLLAVLAVLSAALCLVPRTLAAQRTVQDLSMVTGGACILHLIQVLSAPRRIKWALLPLPLLLCATITLILPTPIHTSIIPPILFLVFVLSTLLGLPYLYQVSPPAHLPPVLPSPCTSSSSSSFPQKPPWTPRLEFTTPSVLLPPLLIFAAQLSFILSSTFYIFSITHSEFHIPQTVFTALALVGVIRAYHQLGTARTIVASCDPYAHCMPPCALKLHLPQPPEPSMRPPTKKLSSPSKPLPSLSRYLSLPPPPKPKLNTTTTRRTRSSPSSPAPRTPLRRPPSSSSSFFSPPYDEQAEQETYTNSHTVGGYSLVYTRRQEGDDLDGDGVGVEEDFTALRDPFAPVSPRSERRTPSAGLYMPYITRGNSVSGIWGVGVSGNLTPPSSSFPPSRSRCTLPARTKPLLPIGPSSRPPSPSPARTSPSSSSSRRANRSASMSAYPPNPLDPPFSSTHTRRHRRTRMSTWGRLPLARAGMGMGTPTGDRAWFAGRGEEGEGGLDIDGEVRREALLARRLLRSLVVQGSPGSVSVE